MRKKNKKTVQQVVKGHLKAGENKNSKCFRKVFTFLLYHHHGRRQPARPKRRQPEAGPLHPPLGLHVPPRVAAGHRPPIRRHLADVASQVSAALPGEVDSISHAPKMAAAAGDAVPQLG